MTLFTVGHSNRTIEDFLAILAAHEVTCLADVRTVPKSRYNPQFGIEALRSSLGDAGVRYVPMPGLGGLRHPKRDSINTGWRNDSFRGYADYMQTADFQTNIDALVDLMTTEGQVVVMCAEAVPWRCHRSMIGDAVLVRGIAVEDIMSVSRRTPHSLTPFAQVCGNMIIYPSAQLTL